MTNKKPKNKKIKPSSGLLRTLFKFLQANGRQKMVINTSPYDTVAEVLIQLGRVKNESESNRSFTIRETEFIRSQSIQKAVTRSIQTTACKQEKKIPAKRDKVRKFYGMTEDFIKSKEFLQTYEWRKVRMMVLKRDGASCSCCGATPATGAVMNVDHIKSRKFFPELALDPDNLQVLCNECNHGKGNWDSTDWRLTNAGEGVTIVH